MVARTQMTLSSERAPRDSEDNLRPRVRVRTRTCDIIIIINLRAGANVVIIGRTRFMMTMMFKLARRKRVCEFSVVVVTTRTRRTRLYRHRLVSQNFKLWRIIQMLIVCSDDSVEYVFLVFVL